MRIALVISSLQTGGAERVASELANFWASRGDDVFLITLCAPGTTSLYALDSRVHWCQLNQATPGNVSVFERLKKLARRILTLRKTLKTVQPDVVVSFVDVTNITTVLASVGLRIPVVVSERTHPAYYSLPVFYQWLRRLSYIWADKVVCQTASASAYFSWLPKSGLGVIPNFVKKAQSYKKAEDIIRSVQRIVSVGRLCKSKGFQDLIQAFAKIVPHNQALKLIIYGEGDERFFLESLVRELRLEGYVFLPGEVQDIHQKLYEADLFVFPSRYEGFPNALCEAMAVGLPVIASSCSGTVDIIRDGIDGRLFPVGDQNQLEALLKELVNDPAQRVRLSQEALAISDRFNQESVWKKWDEVLEEVRRRR